VRRSTACLIAGVTAMTAAIAASPIGSADPGTSISGAGLFIVGKDIQPGTYQSNGPAAKGGRCVWEVHERRQGVNDSRLGGNSATAGPVYAQIPASTATSIIGFLTTGCSTWTLTG
jgi:hypothetical protein